jgi:hypothetical protein
MCFFFLVGSRANCVVVFAPELTGNATRTPLDVPSMSYKGARACQELSRVNGSESVVPEHNNGW